MARFSPAGVRRAFIVNGVGLCAVTVIKLVG